MPSTLSPNNTQQQETQKHKIGFVHLGCPKNLVDTENMLGLLNEAGHEIVGDDNQADLMLVNTCSFIESAQEESVQNLIRLAEQGKKLIITGCLAQKHQEELLDLIPEACALIGTGDMTNVVDVVHRIDRGEQRIVSITQDPKYILENDAHRLTITAGSYVYLKIAEGCDYRCSFCIIPSMRGDFRSRTLQSIVDDAKRYAEKGVSELVLVGQDLTSYGKDIGFNLAQLLQALNEVDGIKWIRCMYAYPNLVSDELLETINGCEKIVKYLDVPLQHMHPEILKRMRRPVMDHVEFVERVRSKIDNVKIRTGLIAGFPGETEAHFDAMCEMVKQAQFDRLGVFGYSDVEGAHSNGLEGKVPKKEIERRRKFLMAQQQPISLKKNQKLLMQTLPVIVDFSDPEKKTFTGRTQWDAPEVDNQVHGKGIALPGEIVNVKITQVGPYDLFGQVEV